MATKHLFRFPVFAFIVVAMFLAGCASKGRVETAPAKPETVTAPVTDPLQVLKNEFWERYEYFIIDYGKVGYYTADLGIAETEEKIFKGLKTIEEFNKFTEIFWKVRDLDPKTSENEYKDEVDNRIKNIQNEAFLLQGVNFQANNGLKGDMARVYLLHGPPSFMETLPEGYRYVELMTWYYVDQSQQGLMRFLFYKQYGQFTVFKKYTTIISSNYLFDPTFSPLREISKGMASTEQEMYELFEELRMDDPRGLFLYALLSFSDYTGVTVDTALDAPEPISITAARYKPVILGRSEIPSDMEMVLGSRKSFLPIKLIREIDPASGKLRFMLHMKYSDMDWEVKRDPQGDLAKDRITASLNLRIRFQNRETLEKAEFFSGVTLNDLRSKLDNPSPNPPPPIRLGDVRNYIAGNGLETLNEFLDRLAPGTYVVDFTLGHMVTKKALTWVGDIVIK